MAYSKDTKEMVLKYLSKGHSYEEARKELGVSKHKFNKSMEKTSKRNRKSRETIKGEADNKIS